VPHLAHNQSDWPLAREFKQNSRKQKTNELRGEAWND
jgi:hypothetical protein